MSEIIEFLVTVRDERDNWKIKHSLVDIVLLIFFARLSGAEYWEDIEDFGKAYEQSLRSVLTLENGIPSHDTMQRVFATLDAQVLVEVTLMWHDILHEADLSAKTFPTFAKCLLAIDGKTIRGNASQTQKALHIVSAYATDLGICYGQVATDDKSNEITAIPDLLDKISVTGCLISIDAIGTQKAIANKIIKKKADYCLAVKENQKGLLEAIQPFFEVSKTEVIDSYETVEKARGQIETRRYEVIHNTSWLRKEYPDWGHRQLDVVFREDANKILNKQLAFNLNVMDKFCLAVLKQLDVGKQMSLRRKKFNLGMNFDQYLNHLI